MNYERAISTGRSTKRRRMAAMASMLAAATMLALAHLHPEATRDAIASMHAAWIRIAAPGMQFPAGRLTLRAFKLWASGAVACYTPRLSARSSRISTT